MSSIVGENIIYYTISAIVIMAVLLGLLSFFIVDFNNFLPAKLLAYIPWIKSEADQTPEPEQISADASPSPSPSTAIIPQPHSPQEIRQTLSFIEYPVVRVTYRVPNIFAPVD